MPHINKLKVIVIISFLLISLSFAFIGTAKNSPEFNDNNFSENKLMEENEPRWPSFGYERRNTHQSPYDSSHVDGSLKWKYDTGSLVAYSSPSIDDEGNIYIGTSANVLHSIDENGTKNWAYDAGGDVSDAIYSTPAITNSSVIFGSRDGYLYSLNQNGSMDWSWRTKGALDSSPKISTDGSIIIGCGDHKLYSVQQDGKPTWAFATDGWIKSTAAIDGRGHIYVGSYDGNFYSIDQSGDEVWSYSSGDGIFSSPAISLDGDVYVGSWDGYFYSFDNNGSLEWRYEIGSKIFSSPAIGPNGNIYVGAQDGKLYAFNNNGSLRWSFQTDDAISSSPAVDSKGNIYFGSEDYHVYSLNSEGGLRWKYETGYTITSSPSIGEDGTVYIASHDHYVYAFTGSPSKPRNIKAESCPERVKLEWDKPKENGGSEIQEYKIYRSKEKDNFTILTSVDPSVREFNDLNVTNNETYYYRVSAVNKDVEGEKSEIVNATPHDTVPSPPVSLSLAEEGLNVHLNWSEPEDNGGSEIINYNVYKGTNSTNLDKITGTNKTYFEDSEIEKGIAYYYYVTAVNDVGGSNPSNLENITITTTPSPPRNLTAEENNLNISINWKVPLDVGGTPVIEYNIYRGTDSSNLTVYDTVSSDLTYYSDNSVDKGSKYYYQVSAVNDVGESDLSNVVESEINTVPTEPVNLSLEVKGDSLSLDWQSPLDDGGSQILNYNVYRGTSKNNLTLFKELSANKTSFEDDTVTKGTTYYYEVTASNKIGESEPTDQVHGTITTVPSKPLNLTAEGYKNNITLEWEEPLDDGGLQILNYKIYRGTSPDNMSFYIDTNSTEHIDSNVESKTTYYYYITAVNNVGESAPSNVVNSSTVSLPSAPLNFEAEPGNSTVNLTWSPPEDTGGEIIEYRIYRGSKRNEIEFLTTVKGNITNYTDNSVENENNYFYRVSAVNNAGEGPKSKVDKARPSWRYAPGMEIIPLMVSLIAVSIYVTIKKKKK